MWRNSSDTPSVPKIAFSDASSQIKGRSNNGMAKIEKSLRYLENGQIEKRQTVDQLKCRDRETDRVIGQLGWTAGRR